MGAYINRFFCIYVINNNIILYKSVPTKCFGTKHQTISFHLQGEVLKIINDYDELIDTQSIISEDDYKIKLLKTPHGIATRPEKIAQYIQNLLRDLEVKGIQKIVFAEPKASPLNKELIFKAIFQGLYNFSTQKVVHAKNIYIDWDLSKEEMTSMIHQIIQKWKILTESE